MLKLTRLMVIFVCAGCAVTHPTSNTSHQYSEDLSVWRLPADTISQNISVVDSNKESLVDRSAFVPAHHDVNDHFYPVLDSIDQLNLAQKFVDGYAIQVYLGNNHDEAFDAKKQFSMDLPRMTAELRYDQPNYQVKTGKYYSRLEAQRDYLTINRYFPSAIIIPDKIPIPQ